MHEGVHGGALGWTENVPLGQSSHRLVAPKKLPSEHTGVGCGVGVAVGVGVGFWETEGGGE